MTRKTRILILLSCLFPWLQAMADPIVTAVGSGSTCPNDEVVVPVTVSNCNGVAAISLALNFDNTKIHYQGYQNLNSVVSSMLVNANGGTVYMTWANMSAVDVDNGTLVELRFKGITGSTGLNWNTSLCEYSDATGNVIQSNYNNGSVNVYAVPAITSHPVNRNLVEGQNTTFEINATGQGLSYQWQIKAVTATDWQDLVNGGNYSNANSKKLNVNNVTLEMNGNQYRCVVSGTCPSPVTSSVATLSVEVYIPPIPTIVTSVGSVSTCPGVFSVPVTVTNCNNVGAISLALNFNQSLVTYIGYENANTQLNNGTMRLNATNGTVYFTWASSNHTLEIGNDELISLVFRSTAGNSSLSWNTAQCEYASLAGNILPTSYNNGSLTIYNPPTITSHPANRTVTEGNSASFSINASGQGLSYQWQMSQDQGISWETLSNGGHYSNVTSRTLNVNNVDLTMEGLRYRCVVNGTCEPSVTSNFAVLHVEGFTPTIVTTAGSLNTCSETEFGIPISVTNCNNVSAISLALSYNTNVLTYAGYEGLNPALDGGQLQVNAVDGMIFIAWASVEGANVGNGNLITIRFTALSGTSSMSWNTAYCEYANPQGTIYPTNYNNGNVSVGDLSFSITSQPANQTVTMEENTSFAVATSGTTSGFQWQVSQDGGASWSNISQGRIYVNPTTNTLGVNNVTLEMNGYRYRCVINGSCGVQYSSVATLTVQLPVNYYEITLAADPTEGGTVEGAGAYESDQNCTVTAMPATGYDFVNWTENGAVVSTEASYTFTVSANRDLVAHFALQELNIVANVIPTGSGNIVGAGSYLYGDHVLLTATPATGFVFNNWTENGVVVSTNQSISFTAQADRNLTANFSVLQLNITAAAVPASNGTVEGAGIYNYGTTVVLTAIPVEGFEFVNWTENDTVVSTNATLSFVAHTDRNFEANFIIQSLNITTEADPEGSGIITGAGTYNYGDPVVLTATPLGNFEFYNWTENGVEVSTQPTLSFNAYNHRNLVAHFFSTITIVATIQPEESGTVSGSGTYNYADPVTLTAQPNTGYAFVNWTENGTVFSTETSISFTAYEDRTIVANFEMIMHHISVEANIGAAGTVSGSGDYQEGTRATVTAVPNAGFEFIRWTENGTSVSTNANYTFSVWAPRDLVAEFDLQITDTTASACDAFEWHGHTYASNGVYYDTLSSYLGIDSIVALHLTIYPSYHYVFNKTECENYFWEDVLYTESGDYTREYHSIYGCDSILTLHLTILPIRPLGNFTYMSPANNYIDRFTDMDFYWDAIPNANCYDFYFWQGEGGKPNTPMVSNTTAHSYQIGGLTHESTYHWCVVAKNECQEIESDTRTFTCQLNPAMTVVPNGWYDFGEVEVGQTLTRTISVSGTALTEDISYAYLDNAWGQDADFFAITPSNWSPTSGGLLHITFAPEATQLYYNAGIRIASGTFVDTLYFTGSLANRYVFTTNVDGDVFSANDEITITGHVEDVLGNPVSDMEVSVYLIVMGTRTTGTAVSDANGNYSTTYTPRYSESGYYQIGSCAYGTYSNDVHDSFDIPGMSRVSSDFVIWQPYQDETLTGTIEIRNRSSIPISNIQVNTISLPNGCSVSFTGVTSLGPLETGLLNYTVTGSQVTSGSDYEEANFVVTADNGITMNMTCYYYCRQRRGALDVYPPSVATTMKRYNQKALSFQITNNGIGETGPITVSLPDVEWMSLLGSATLESLPVGDSCAFSVMLAPDEDVNLVQYNGSIAVNCANGNGIAIPYVIEASSDSTGVLRVDVTDDNTYNGNGDHLAGADVYVKGYYSLEMVAQGVTDENGLFIVENLPEGYYYLTIHATQHSNYEAGIVYIEGGKTNHQNIYLQYQAISYSWVVTPTEIEDEYEFELVAEIKTNVPVPVVTVDCPSKIDTLAYGDTIQFNLTVTNHGLVDAYDTQLTMPTEFPEYDFIPMIDFIDTLHAKTSVVIPCIVTRTQRNRTNLSDYHCYLGKGRTISGYYCNLQKEWVEFSFTIGFRVHCNYTGPDNPIVNFPAPTQPPTPTPTPIVCPDCIPTPPPSGPGWLEWLGEHWPWTIDPSHGSEDIATTSQDCTPCVKVLVSELGHIASKFIPGAEIVPIADIFDCYLYEGEIMDVVKTIIISESMMFNPLLGIYLQHHLTLSYNLMQCLFDVTQSWAISASIGVVSAPLQAAYNFVDEVEGVNSRIRDCIIITNNSREDEDLGNAIEQFNYCSKIGLASFSELANLFQEEEWYGEENIIEFMANFISIMDTVTGMVPNQSVQQLKDACELTSVNDSIIQRFVDRWNRSIQYWAEGIFTSNDLPEGYLGDFIELDTLRDVPVQEAIEAAQAYGFESIGEMFSSSVNRLYDNSLEHKTDVCAKISVSFKQTMTMTREAFEGTLKIYNGHTTDPMQDINVDIVIKDKDGVDCTNLFQINVTSLNDITGVDGSGTLAVQTEGIAQFIMIPTIEAAPDTTKIYYFGGTFSFLDPFSGSEMTYDLFPVQLKVNPGPNLHVDYFISRHIISDDPLTDSIIEPAEPAELAMMISNVGAGDANNVYLESSQPQITDNQNGLLISFDMVGAAMNGEMRPLGLTDIPFGTIGSHSAGIAEWYFTSSLMARVVHSTPHVIHNNSYGNPNLSLVTELHSHDLIKAIRAYGSLEDGINDFFVNETADFDHTPDKIYFSNGGTADVRKIIVATTEGELSEENDTILLNLTPIAAGWNYACLDDPAQGLREIVSCTRNDGQEIPLSNVWVSHVTMLDEGAPIHENKLHIVDTLAVNQTTTYTIVYAEALSNLRIFFGDEDEYWSNAANWQGNIIPQADDEVLIDGICLLDEDVEVFSLTVAEDQSLTIPEDRILTVTGILTNEVASRLIIEEGGQLMHGNDGVRATVQKAITPFTPGNRDGWFLIASPFADNTDITSVVNMLSNEYDLYYYDEPTHYWRNQKNSANNFTQLANGKGYLYANSIEVSLEFVGTLENGKTLINVPLSYTEGIPLKGFNLIGNPFAHNVTSYAAVNVANGCYLMNEAADDFIVSEISEEYPLKPVDGFFVRAVDEGASITFNSSRGLTTSHNGSIYVEVVYEGKLFDRLIVKKEGDSLEKLSLNETRTKLFVTNNHQEFAIVSYEGNEQPINFKAAKNGTYTINVNTNGTEFKYLHLIDNLTGADVDLLVEPSYTFEAKMTDYASRFRLVFFFSEDADGDNTCFAFINNGNIIIIDAEADAILQILDMMGHVLLTTDVTHNISTNGLSAGVYVLRLICGEKMKTQKIVIE